MASGRRPVIASKEKRDRFLAALRGGHYVETACAFAGVSRTAIFRAIAIGEDPNADPDTPNLKAYRDFADAVRAARGHAEVQALLTIRNDTSWQSSAWYLERAFPQRWGKRDRVEVSGPEEGSIQVAVRDEAALDVARAIRDAVAGISMQPPDETSALGPAQNGSGQHVGDPRGNGHGG